MRFSTILTTLAIGSALAIPPPLEKRATPVSVIGDSVATLQNAVAVDSQALTTASSKVTGAIGASLTIVAAISANVTAIAGALQQAAAVITVTTIQSANGTVGAVVNLGQAEVDLLTTDVKAVVTLLLAIKATITVTFTNLGPALTVVFKDEFNALAAAVAPFAAPLLIFAKAVEQASASATVTVTGLAAASAGLTSAVADVAQSIGVPV